MTELQKKEFEILKLFVDICNQLNLDYYLVCGSALGAVKYEGFIPWDDDIDVALPRKDYEIFLSKAPSLLPSWCFLQNYRTDPKFPLLGTKLRDSRTTFVECMCGELDINHGTFIDVFPLDGYSHSKKNDAILAKERRIFEGARRVNLTYRRFSPSNILSFTTMYYYLMNRLFGVYGDTAFSVKSFDALVSSFNAEATELLCNHANSVSPTELAPHEQYGTGAWAKFEGLKVRIPEKYDEYLTQKYGDWRADLPKEEQVGHHYAAVIDLDHPYTDYVEKLANGKIRIKSLPDKTRK